MSLPQDKTNWRTLVVWWRCLIPLSQAWGVLASFVLLGIGIHQVYRHHVFQGVSVILTSISVFSLESYWLWKEIKWMNKVISALTGWWQVTSDWKCPSHFWKKALVYWLTSLFFFMMSKNSFLCEVSGIQLITLAGLYFLMYIQHEIKVHLLYSPSYAIIHEGYRSRNGQMPLGVSKGNEMVEFNRMNPESEPDEEDTNLLEILSIDQDPMLTM